MENVSGIGDISVHRKLKEAIATQLDELPKSFDGYFPTRYPCTTWMRGPFTLSDKENTTKHFARLAKD